MADTTCQAAKRANASVKRASRLVKPLLLAALLGLTAGAVSVGADDLPNRLFAGKQAPLRPPYPAAPMPSRDRLISPPGEERFFPVRTDGQPYVLNIDTTVNLTQALNQFYYDPRWRGEVWTPFDTYSSVERAQRMMGTWKEYDEFSQLRWGNHWHKFWERYSGFGP